MFDFEEIDYSLLSENKMTGDELNSWIHIFITDHAPSFEDAKKFFVKKGVELKKKEYEKACRKRSCKSI